MHGRLIASVLLPFAAGYFLSYVFRTVNAVIATDLAAELGLNAADLGLLTGVYFLIFAAVQLPLGALLDRAGPALVQSVLMLFAGVGALVFALADGFLGLLVGRALIGLGVAVALMAGVKAIAVWAPPGRSALATGWLVMLGALGALMATAPADLLVQAIGWRGLFVVLAALSALACLLILFAAPGSRIGKAPNLPSLTFSQIYGDARFWRIAPLSALGIGTSWSLQSLWAAPWLRDVEGLERPAIVHHLSVMAIAVCAGALVLGMAADRLRRAGIKTETVLAATLTLSALAQGALFLQWPLPPLLPFTVIAAAGAATVLSFAVLGEYFPKAMAGRANGALNLLHVGSAFAVQSATGVLIALWPQSQGGYPAEAHRTAMAIILVFQLSALAWFAIPRSSKPLAMNPLTLAIVCRNPVRSLNGSGFAPPGGDGSRPAKDRGIVIPRVGYVLAGLTAALGVLWLGLGELSVVHALSALASAAVAMFAIAIVALAVSDWCADVHSRQAWTSLALMPARLRNVKDAPAVGDIDPRYLASDSDEPLRQVLPNHRSAAQVPRSLSGLTTSKSVLPAVGGLASQVMRTVPCWQSKHRAKSIATQFRLVANGDGWSDWLVFTNPRVHRPAGVVALSGTRDGQSQPLPKASVSPGGTGRATIASSHGPPQTTARHSIDPHVHDNLGQRIPIRRAELEVIESYLERELRALLTAVGPADNGKDI